MTNYKLCISGPDWVLEAIKHLINTFTNKKANGPYSKNGGAGHLQIFEKD